MHCKHVIGVWDLFIGGGGGGRGAHTFWQTYPNHESMPESPPALKILLSGGVFVCVWGGGGGGEGVMHSFCVCVPQKCTVFYPRIMQVTPDKIFRQETKNEIKKVFPESLHNFYPNFVQTLPKFARILSECRKNFARIRYNSIFFFFFFFFFGGEHSAPCHRLIRLW